MRGQELPVADEKAMQRALLDRLMGAAAGSAAGEPAQHGNGSDADDSSGDEGFDDEDSGGDNGGDDTGSDDDHGGRADFGAHEGGDDGDSDGEGGSEGASFDDLIESLPVVGADQPVGNSARTDRQQERGKQSAQAAGPRQSAAATPESNAQVPSLGPHVSPVQQDDLQLEPQKLLGFPNLRGNYSSCLARVQICSHLAQLFTCRGLSPFAGQNDLDVQLHSTWQ